MVSIGHCYFSEIYLLIVSIYYRQFCLVTQICIILVNFVNIQIIASISKSPIFSFCLYKIQNRIFFIFMLFVFVNFTQNQIFIIQISNFLKILIFLIFQIIVFPVIIVFFNDFIQIQFSNKLYNRSGHLYFKVIYDIFEKWKIITNYDIFIIRVQPSNWLTGNISIIY